MSEGELASHVYLTKSSLKRCYVSTHCDNFKSNLVISGPDISTSLSVWNLDSYQRIFVFSHLMS